MFGNVGAASRRQRTIRHRHQGAKQWQVGGVDLAHGQKAPRVTPGTLELPWRQSATVESSKKWRRRS